MYMGRNTEEEDLFNTLFHILQILYRLDVVASRPIIIAPGQGGNALIFIRWYE